MRHCGIFFLKRGWRLVALAALMWMTSWTGAALANTGPEASETNPPPSPLNVTVGQSLDYDISPHFTDPDGDALTFQLIQVDRFPLNEKTCGATDCFANLSLSTDGRLTGSSSDITDEGDYFVIFNVIDQAGSNTEFVWVLPLYLQLSGEIGVSPSSHTFPTTEVGASVSQTFTVTNTATSGPLALRSFSLNNPTQFAIKNNTCVGATLNPGETCTLDIRFAPQAAGTQVTGLIIRSSDPTEEGDYQYSVSLQGSGFQLLPNIAVTPQNHNFGTIEVGQSSANQTFTVYNLGDKNLSVTGVSLAGTDATDFRLGSSTCATITPGLSCTVQASFRPTTSGLKIAALAITSDDPDTPTYSVSLTGTGEGGTTLEDPAITVSPSSRDFGTVAFGASAAQEFTVTNAGGMPLSVSSASITGTDAASFAIPLNTVTGQTIEAGQSRILGVSFSPSRLGNHAAILRLASNDPLAPVKEVPLTGNGGPAGRLYFPHVDAKPPWNTEICVVNASKSQHLSGRFLAYNDNGSLVTEKSNISLPPYGRLEMDVAETFTGAESIGHLIFESTSGTLTGYTKFHIQGRYRVAVPAVTSASTGTLYLSHIDSSDQWWTGVSLVNTTDSSKTLTLSFNTGETRTITIAAGGHYANTIAGLFDGTRKPDIQSGIIANAAGIVGLELFGSHEGSDTSYLSGVLLGGNISNTLYYPHVDTSAQWWTGIVAYNVATTQNDLLVTSYDRDGTLLESHPIILAAHEKYIGTVQQLGLPENTAWFQIASLLPITGFELFGTNDGRQLAGYTGVGINRASGVFAKVESDGWTGIAFVNAVGEENEVTLTAFTDAGQSVATRKLMLSAYEKVVDVVENLFPEGIGPATYVRYDADREVVGFQLNGASDGTMLDGLPGM